MDEQKQSLIDRIKQAQNILVTVSTNPSVDQLSAAIGLTLALNKLDKHGTAVFSGQVPDTIEFLRPEETLEKNTDSLRDFIIALDKSKADKLRYKVEDDVVRIFITPYRTSLGEKDLQFSQGDFNVDVVVALGVSEQKDLDAAITAHGRILHDATVASVSTVAQTDLGTLNWVDPAASSLCEMVVTLVDGLDSKTLDEQIATALLTGIVANTERFSNDKTTPKTMSASAELMAAGANQKLIASELENPSMSAPAQADADSSGAAAEDASAQAKGDSDTLEIAHRENSDNTEEPKANAEEPAEAPSEPKDEAHPQVRVDENGELVLEDEAVPEISQVHGVASKGETAKKDDEPKRGRMTEPPKFNDVDLTANAEPEDETADPSTETLSLPADNQPLLTHNENTLDDGKKNTLAPSVMLPPLESGVGSPPAPESSFTPQLSTPSAPASDAPLPSLPFTPAAPDVTPAEPTHAPVDDDSTLAEIESSVHSSHTDQPATTPNTDVDSARNAVEAALNNAPTTSDVANPIAGLSAQPLGDSLEQTMTPPSMPVTPVPNTGFSEPTPGNTPADSTLDMPLPSNPFGPGQQSPLIPAPTANPSTFPGTPPPPGGQTPPPPVPPPMLPPLQ